MKAALNKKRVSFSEGSGTPTKQKQSSQKSPSLLLPSPPGRTPKTTKSLSKSKLLPPITQSEQTPRIEEENEDDLDTGGTGATPADERLLTSDLDLIPAADDEQPPTSASSAREYTRTEVPADSSSPTKLPPLAKPQLKKPAVSSTTPAASRWDNALKFVNDRVSTELTRQLLNNNSGFDDYETSDVSLDLLEKRIKTFFTEHVEGNQLPPPPKRRLSMYSQSSRGDDQDDMKLPPLARYQVDLQDSDVTIPKPGGKVWIRKRLCRFANSSIKVKDHEHVRYHMVPELPEFQEVQKARVVMHRFLTASQSPDKTPTTTSQGHNPFITNPTNS